MCVCVFVSLNRMCQHTARVAIKFILYRKVIKLTEVGIKLPPRLVDLWTGCPAKSANNITIDVCGVEAKATATVSVISHTSGNASHRCKSATVVGLRRAYKATQYHRLKFRVRMTFKYICTYLYAQVCVQWACVCLAGYDIFAIIITSISNHWFPLPSLLLKHNRTAKRLFGCLEQSYNQHKEKSK